MPTDGAEVTDRPTSGSKGLRIAASRAGAPADVDYELVDRPGRDSDGGRPDAAPRRRARRVAAGPAAPVAGRTPDTERVTPVVPAVAPRAPVGPRGRAALPPARAKILRQRRRRRRLLIVVTAFTAVCTLFVGLGAAYLESRLGQIRRVRLPTLADDTPGAVMNVLLVGSDSRANLEGKDAQGFGKDTVGGQRSDTIMLLHVDPRQQKAAIVSVPRDLYVPIAGTTYSDRVNTAFAVGGPDQLVDTVQRALGITVNHYVQVDFVGFKDIVDTVGGVTIYLPYPVRDSGSGLDLGKSGCFELDGQKGLSWVRSRNMEFLIDGTWQTDGRGDLGRIERQQDFIRRMMKKALSSGVTNPLQLNRLIGIGVKDVTFDSSLSTKDISSLGRRFSSLDPDRVVLRTLPTDPADIDGKAVLKLQSAQSRPMIDLLNGKAPVEPTTTTVAGTTPVGPAPAAPTTAAGPTRGGDVKVRVLNGVGTAGAAGKAAAALTSAGFVVADKGDAPALAPKTTITYGAGQLAKAQLLAGSLLGPAVVKEDATLKAVDVTLLLGADYTGLKPGASAATPTTAATTTTQPPQINPVPIPKGAAAPC